ncbi:gas vesicle protein [Nonomuraea sp. MCN248]|uniref:Gas vesicle protein n=1 Tax=Nonomuraea corallina TaxID=2989783 RepID=A0ABT4S6N7_9ACTN|nr:gas vesicle protein GvpJ [Nonomuraea corallina]MDA0632856.1 gas vesicle protein [Nonomuraea corallina]
MTGPEPRGGRLAAEGYLPEQRVALVDLLDRLLTGGVVVTGDVVLSISGLDLVRISLRALLVSVREDDAIEGGMRHDGVDRPAGGATWGVAAGDGR